MSRIRNLLAVLLVAITLPATARASSGSDLAEGNLLVRGGLGLDFQHLTTKPSGAATTTQKQINVQAEILADYLLLDWFSIGAYLRSLVQYDWTSKFADGSATGLLDLGARLTGWFPILGSLYVIGGLNLGYAHQFAVGTDGNGVSVGPEIGLALPMDTFIGYVTLGYTFYWLRTKKTNANPQTDCLVHRVPLMVGFGGRF